MAQENIMDYLNRKYHDGILQSKSAYNANRQKDVNVHGDKRKAPEAATPGLFYSVFG